MERCIIRRCLLHQIIMKKKVAFGENSTREHHSGCCYGSHAEMEAIRKLPPTRGSRNIHIDLIVIRISKSGLLKNSQPCSKCLEYLHNLCLKTSYKIKHVYYSDSTGQIVKTKFDRLLSNDRYISSGFRSKML